MADRDKVMWPGIAGVVALVAGVGLLQRADAPPPPSVQTSESSVGNGPAPAASVATLGAHRAFAMLAEALGVSLTQQDAVKSVDLLREQLSLHPSTDEAAASRTTASIDTLRSAVAGGLAGRDATERQRAINAMAEVEGYFAQRPDWLRSTAGAAEALKRVASHVRDTADQDTYRFLQKVARERHVDVDGMRFLVASVPDYVDSNSDWMADDLLDALQRSAFRAQFTMDRFHFPEMPGAQEKGVTAAIAGGLRSHESEPGVMLFKKFRPSDEPNHPPIVDLLVVFVITETATAGVHQSAFLHAAQFVRGWRMEAEAHDVAVAERPRTASDIPDKDKLQVLGPVFSGAAVSLRAGLERFLCESPTWPRAVQVVSGTATNPSNRETLTFTVEPGSPTCSSGISSGLPALERRVEVTFKATVRSDPDLSGALEDYLESLNPKWNDGNGVALLTESTAYGEWYSNAVHLDQSKIKPFPQALTLSFPLHISRLRGVAAQPARPPGGRAGGVSLRMDQRSAATDMVPTVTPGLTLATIELSLANILSTIAREQITAVGIFATDKRDLLFLAREITKVAPNVLLFTSEGHLILTHPDYASFLRGTVVASSYPLFSATQVLSDSFGASKTRDQFATNSAEGVFNAALTLIAPWEPLLDYGVTPTCYRQSPDDPTEKPDDACIPPVWVSVVGQNALWPVRAMPTSAGGDGYVQPAFSSWQLPDKLPSSPIVSPPIWMNVGIVLVVAIACLHVGLFVMARPRRTQRSAKSSLPSVYSDLPGVERIDQSEEDIPVERRRFLLCCAMTSGLVAAWLLAAAIVAWFGTYPPRWVGWTLVGGLGFGLLLAMVFTIRDRLGAAGSITKTWVTSYWSTPAQSHWQRATVVGLLMAVMAGMSGYYLSRHTYEVVNQSAIDAQLFLVRVLEPSSGVSPACAVVLLGAALYLWAFWNYRQLSMAGAVYIGQADSGLFRLLCGDEASGRESRPAAGDAQWREPLRHEITQLLASPWRRSRVGLSLIVIAVVAAYGIASQGNGYAIDGWSLGAFLWWATWLAVFVTVHALSQTVHLTTLLLRMLRHLGTHHIAPAFGRVAKNGWFELRLSPRPNRTLALAPAVRLAQSLEWRLQQLAREAMRPMDIPSVERRALSGLGATLALGPTPLALQLRVRTASVDALGPALTVLQSADARIADTPDEAFQKSAVWSQLVALTSVLVPVLHFGRWRRPDRADDSPVKAWHETAEDLIALQAAFVIRDVLSRIVSGLGVVMVISFLILGGHLFYAFQGRQLFIWLDFVLMGTIAAFGAGILLTLEKNKVLSLLWSTDPGRINWNGGFVYRIALYVGIPFITILASQFPELVGSLADWIEPLQKALP